MHVDLYIALLVYVEICPLHYNGLWLLTYSPVYGVIQNTAWLLEYRHLLGF